MDKKEYYRRWSEKNKDHLKAYKKQYRKDNAKKIYEYNKKYMENNPKKTKEWSQKCYYKHHEERLKYGSDWQKNNRKKANERNKRWRLNNPERSKLHSLRRQTNLKKINNAFSQKDWVTKCTHCYGCGTTENLQMDHILPISKAPENHTYTIDDIQPLCNSCNSTKSDKLNWTPK